MEKIIDNFKKNWFNVEFYENREKFLEEFVNNFSKEDKIAFGGSTTIDQLNLYEVLKEKDLNLFWHWRDADLKDALDANIYISSANAVSAEGAFYNIDKFGNRIGAISFGPEKVYIIVGTNKIEKNNEKAKIRAQEIAAPLNAKRLNTATPCVETGKCADCAQEDRICRFYQEVKKNVNDKITIVFIDEDLGY